jgi:hypothetical protein
VTVDVQVEVVGARVRELQADVELEAVGGVQDEGVELVPGCRRAAEHRDGPARREVAQEVGLSHAVVGLGLEDRIRAREGRDLARQGLAAADTAASAGVAAETEEKSQEKDSP